MSERKQCAEERSIVVSTDIQDSPGITANRCLLFASKRSLSSKRYDVGGLIKSRDSGS